MLSWRFTLTIPDGQVTMPAITRAGRGRTTTMLARRGAFLLRSAYLSGEEFPTGSASLAIS